MLKDSPAFSGFSVKSLAETEKFYGEILGLDIERSDEGLRLKLGTGPSVFIYEKPNHQPATFTILNFPVKDLEKTVEELIAKGITFEHYTGELQTDEKGIMRGQGPDIAWFKDPSGNFLSVIQE